ncbi:unnamed protein product [Callosobruchus maculatus]|uniref:Cytochrome P450 n=1 Tax=Callosobruchus maculatus TaxID=64391 RepID=A0A653D1C2_CALMS|nr:unnamed protein product [Callosobruchus maculatus]
MAKSLKGENISLAHVNVRSLLSNFGNLKAHVLEKDFTFLLVSETWLSRDVSDSEVAIEGYKILRNDRAGRGGGVAIYLSSQVPCVQISKDLNRYLGKNLGDLEMKEVCAKFSTDAIARCAFGLNSHCFEDENSAFRKCGRRIFDFNWRNGIIQTAYFFRPHWVTWLRLDFFEREVSDYLVDAFSSVMTHREKTNIKGNDFLDLLIDLKKNQDFREKFAFETTEATAQAFQFFVAGFETTSSTISYTLYELCKRPKYQNTLREEIKAAMAKDGDITYENLMGMKYLDMCVQETLRMYPVLPFLDRRCNTEYKIPNSDLVIEKGLPVYIPMFGLHFDEKYFPEPFEYKPERFENGQSAYNKDGLVFLPFGEGPRICIGERFGLLATKLALVRILSEFEVVRNMQTPDVVEFDPKTFILQSKVGLPMKVKKLMPTPA